MLVRIEKTASAPTHRSSQRKRSRGHAEDRCEGDSPIDPFRAHQWVGPIAFAAHALLPRLLRQRQCPDDPSVVTPDRGDDQVSNTFRSGKLRKLQVPVQLLLCLSADAPEERDALHDPAPKHDSLRRDHQDKIRTESAKVMRSCVPNRMRIGQLAQPVGTGQPSTLCQRNRAAKVLRAQASKAVEWIGALELHGSIVWMLRNANVTSFRVHKPVHWKIVDDKPDADARPDRDISA
uniref:Uncharacterized protein n=1 Tax=Chrysotila carterae TaxID=13221 RepID=A0A7S4C737_CHRCT|mmetsp:Transcript_25331/g.52974  ORF Transcript_25331/g.52974 Transcript_25331/m.52974 type:complete len:235 (-) Transcript_25331:478-1182(-)